MRKILSLLIILLLFSSLVVPVTAATTSSSALKLNDLGLLLNVTDSELNSSLTREVGLTMILKAIGYTQSEADAASRNGYFRDVDDWAKGWAELAYLEGITKGVDDHTFNPSGSLSEKEFVVFMLRALEYETTIAWENAVSLGVESGLVEASSTLTDSIYTKSDAAEVMFNSLTSTMQKSGEMLIEKLINDGVVNKAKADYYGLTNTDFRMLSYTNDNLKVVQLKFSSDIDEESLTNDTIEVSKNDSKVMFDSNILDEVGPYKYAFDVIDSKTINIVFGTACAQSDLLTINIDGLKSEIGEEIVDFKVEFKVKDTENPRILSIDAINQKVFKIFFSEPVQFKIGSKVFDHILIDNIRFAGTAYLSNDKQVATFELVNEMSVGEHEIFVEGTTDYAGHVGEDSVHNITVEKDNMAPYVISAKAPNRNEVVVEFSEEINKTRGFLEIGGNTYNLTNTSKVIVDGRKVYITLDVSLTASEAFSSITGYYKDVEDMIGNKVSTRTGFDFKADFDDNLPTLSAKVNSSNQIVVTFSEEVQSFTSINYVVLDDEDKIISSSVNQSGSSKTIYIISLSNPMIDKQIYTLSVKGVKDVSVIQNTIEDTEIALTMLDKNQPTIKSVKLVDDETVRITYSEPMNYDLLMNPEYYSFRDVSENSLLPLSKVSDYRIDVDSSGEYVDIFIDNMLSSDRITVGKMLDESGMTLKNYNTEWSITAPEAFKVLNVEATLIERNKVKLRAIGHEFQVVSPDDFVIRTSSGDSLYHYIYSAQIDSDDPSIVYLEISSNIGTDAKYDGKTQYLYIVEDSLTMDIYNQKLEITKTSPLKISDGIAPYVEVDLEVADTISIVFSETVSADTDFIVENNIILKNKDGVTQTLTAGVNLHYFGGTLNKDGFTKVTLTGLNGGEVYTLRVVSSYIQDAAGHPVDEFEVTSFTVKE